MNGGESVGDRESQASSTDLNDVTNAALVLDADDREGVLTEDDEPDTPVKPSLRLLKQTRLSPTPSHVGP